MKIAEFWRFRLKKCKQITKIRDVTFAKFLMLERVQKLCRNVNLIEFVNSFPTSIYSQKSASMQPVTSPLKCAPELA